MSGGRAISGRRLLACSTARARRLARECQHYSTPGEWRSGLVNLHVLEIAGLVVDADPRGRYPGGEFAALPAGRHQALDEIAVGLGGQPLVLPLGPLGLAQHLTRRRGLDVGELADVAVE